MAFDFTNKPNGNSINIRFPIGLIVLYYIDAITILLQ